MKVVSVEMQTPEMGEAEVRSMYLEIQGQSEHHDADDDDPDGGGITMPVFVDASMKRVGSAFANAMFKMRENQDKAKMKAKFQLMLSEAVKKRFEEFAGQDDDPTTLSYGELTELLDRMSKEDTAGKKKSRFAKRMDRKKRKRRERMHTHTLMVDERHNKEVDKAEGRAKEGGGGGGGGVASEGAARCMAFKKRQAVKRNAGWFFNEATGAYAEAAKEWKDDMHGHPSTPKKGGGNNKNSTIAAAAFQTADADGSGKLTLFEFIGWWRSYGLRQVFDKFDADHSGYIDGDELSGFLKELGVTQLYAEDEVIAMIKPMHEGSISYAECLRWWHCFDVRATFDRYDADGSDSIDLKELANVVLDLGVNLDEAELNGAMEALDADSSGHVSFAEFLPWWNTQCRKKEGDISHGAEQRCAYCNSVTKSNAAYSQDRVSSPLLKSRPRALNAQSGARASSRRASTPDLMVHH